MSRFALVLGILSFLLLVATGQRVSLAFAAGLAVFVMTTGIHLQNRKTKKAKRGEGAVKQK